MTLLRMLYSDHWLLIYLLTLDTLTIYYIIYYDTIDWRFWYIGGIATVVLIRYKLTILVDDLTTIAYWGTVLMTTLFQKENYSG